MMKINREGLSTLFQMIVSGVLFFGTIGLVVLLVVNKRKPEKQPDTRKAPLVQLIEVGAYLADSKIEVTGVTMPFREITIAAEVTGVITEKTEACKAGRYVDEGTHLLSIDSEKYDLAVKRLESEVAEAKARQKRVAAELEAARKILELAESDFVLQQQERDRMEGLFQSKVISDAEWNQAQRTYNAAANAQTTQKSKVETLEAELEAQASLVDLKEVQLREARVDFQKAMIDAPANGVVITDDVQKDDFVQVGKTLLVFEDTSAAEIKCDLRADQLQRILDTQPEILNEKDRFKLPPLPARIQYSSNDRTYNWTGRLDRYDGLGLDERTRTAPCRIHVDQTVSQNGRRTLVRGMYVSVELNLGQQAGLLAIPAEALRAGNVIWAYQPITEKPAARDESTASEDDEAQPGDAERFGLEENEVLGELQKYRIEVVNRVNDHQGVEWVVAKRDEAVFREGTLLVISPIPQPIDGMKLRYQKGTVRQGIYTPPDDQPPTTGTAPSEPRQSSEKTDGEMGKLGNAAQPSREVIQ